VNGDDTAFKYQRTLFSACEQHMARMMVPGDRDDCPVTTSFKSRTGYKLESFCCWTSGRELLSAYRHHNAITRHKMRVFNTLMQNKHSRSAIW